MKKKGKLLICLVLVVLISFTGSAMFAGAAAAQDSELEIVEIVQKNVSKKEIKNINRFMKSSRKNKNSKNYIENLIEEYDIEAAELNDIEAMIIQDEYIAISPLGYWGNQDMEVPELPGGGGGTSESGEYKDSEGYMRITTFCAKLNEKSPDGNSIWKITGTAYVLKDFALHRTDVFAILHDNNAAFNSSYSETCELDYQGIIFLPNYQSKYGGDIFNLLGTVEYVNFGINTKINVTVNNTLWHIRKATLTYYVTVSNSSAVQCTYLHNERLFPLDLSLSFGPLSISSQDSNTPYNARPVSLYK